MVKVYHQWGDPIHAHSYRPAGAVSNYINNLNVGDSVQFKHIAKNIKIQYPFTGVKTITMLAVGAGIAPMIQALHKHTIHWLDVCIDTELALSRAAASN